MNRYIEANLIKYEPMCRARGNGMYEDCEIAYKDQIDDIPTADVRKNIKAKKVLAGGILDGTTHWYECSHCHGAVDILDAYCKHCGAVLELDIDRFKEFLKLTEGEDGKQE